MKTGWTSAVKPNSRGGPYQPVSRLGARRSASVDLASGSGALRRSSWQPTQPVRSPYWTLAPLRIDWIIIPSSSSSWKYTNFSAGTAK